jgi:hypothetical protein
MKIIGVAGEHYIVNAHKDEVANLIGFQSAYGIPNEKATLAVNAEVNVSDLYKRAMIALNNYLEMKKQIESLRSQANKILSIINRESIEGK